MKPISTSIGLLLGAVVLSATGPLPAERCETQFCINWHSIAAGGVIEAESADQQWQLSGTIGQWEATEASALSGGPWRLTGGFWGFSLEELADLLFRDRFEAETTSRASQ